MDNEFDDIEIKGWLMDQLPYEVVWINEHGQIINANIKFCEAIGYSKKECSQLNIADINITVTPVSWKKHWEEVHENINVRFNTTHRTKGGKFYEVEVNAQSFSYNGKKYICAILYERTKSSFYNNLIDDTQALANVGGWELNLYDGSILVTAFAMGIFKSETPEDLTPPKVIHNFKDSDRLKKLLSGVIRKGESFNEILETKDRPPRYIRAAAKPIIKGEKIYKILGVYQDVSESKQKENDLALFKTVMDNAQDLFYVYNYSGDLIYYSQSIVDKLGYSRQELDNMNMFELDKVVTPEFYAAHFEMLKQKGAHSFEWSIEKKDGTSFPVDIISNHLTYQGEDFCCSVVRDITLQKKQDGELKMALEEIQSLKERLENENEYLLEEISRKLNFNNIICKSETYKEVLLEVNQVAPTDTTVLITGESGTGKELLASAVHSNSRRKERPLIKVNCATLPKDLIESELFGHKKGAFTGAISNKVGKFSLADGGTIFLDEIGELPLELQPKILRAIQEGEIDELGGTRTIKVDVRIIAATNRDLKEMIREGKFREDLFYRLNVFPIHNLPLRERKEDIPLLAQFFLEKYAVKAGKTFKRISKETIKALIDYDFPGNIRELENLIERAVIVENGTTLKPGRWLPEKEILNQMNDFKSFEEKQRDYIIKVLDHTNWRVSGPNGAAKVLKLKDKTLFAKMKRLGIEKKVSLKP